MSAGAYYAYAVRVGTVKDTRIIHNLKVFTALRTFIIAHYKSPGICLAIPLGKDSGSAPEMVLCS